MINCLCGPARFYTPNASVRTLCYEDAMLLSIIPFAPPRNEGQRPSQKNLLDGRVCLLGLNPALISLAASVADHEDEEEEDELPLVEYSSKLFSRLLEKPDLIWKNPFSSDEELIKIARSIALDTHSAYEGYVKEYLKRGFGSKELEAKFLVELTRISLREEKNPLSKFNLVDWIFISYQQRRQDHFIALIDALVSADLLMALINSKELNSANGCTGSKTILIEQLKKSNKAIPYLERKANHINEIVKLLRG